MAEVNVIYPTGAANNGANTPSIASAATAIAANVKRLAWSIQNLGQNVLYVNLGGTASTTVFHFALKAGTANDDGLGGIASQFEGVVWQGIITIAGTSPRYTVLEIAP